MRYNSTFNPYIKSTTIERFVADSQQLLVQGTRFPNFNWYIVKITRFVVFETIDTFNQFSHSYIVGVDR